MTILSQIWTIFKLYFIIYTQIIITIIIKFITKNLIAGILKTRINLLWCERIGNKYKVELETISRTDENPDGVVNLGKDKISNTTKLMQLYINSLQKRVIKNPQLWFNFYDYWNQDVKTKI